MATQQTNKAVPSASLQDQSHFVRNFAIVAGLVTALAIALLLLPDLLRDNWELKNGIQVEDKLKEAEQLRSADFMKANEIYEQVLTEASTHTITNDALRQALDDAKAKKNTLQPFVQEELARRAAEQQRVEKQRQKEEERQRQVVDTEASFDRVCDGMSCEQVHSLMGDCDELHTANGDAEGIAIWRHASCGKVAPDSTGVFIHYDLKRGTVIGKGLMRDVQ